MKKNILWITETAVLLALLITLQALTKPFGQMVTGSCVNAVLAVAALLVGMRSGITIGVVSPVCAYLLGIAPNFVTVLPIMVANVCYVVVLHLIAGKTGSPIWRQPVAVVAAAGVKFATLYLLVVKLICGVASGALLGKKIGETVVLAPPMLKMLPAMFSWPQLFTALIGGGVAFLIVPPLRKALSRI